MRLLTLKLRSVSTWLGWTALMTLLPKCSRNPLKSDGTSAATYWRKINSVKKKRALCQQAMVFLVVMYGCESWIIKKINCWRTDAFELWCWKRLLRVPWTARRSNQSVLKEINPEYSLEGMMLKLKLQYLGHLMRKADSLEKTLILERLRAGGEGGGRGWDG